MNRDRSVYVLQNNLGFSSEMITKLTIFHDLIIEFNKKNNLISKSTINQIWFRHILDSAQLVKYINFTKPSVLFDLGSGAGFPGLVLSIYNTNEEFHVKLYEKSPLKCNFLRKIIEKLELSSVQVYNKDVTKDTINGKYVVCRAFKKLDKIIRFSRENTRKGTKFIILKGQNAHIDSKLAFSKSKIRYKLEQSITDSKSKILFFESE